MEQVIPIPTLHLFKVLDKMLLELLASLSPDDWHKPTVAKQWTVKDIAAHLLDGNVRAIATADHYQSKQLSPQINSYQDLVAWLNELNAVWVKAMQRASPEFLIDQLKRTGKQYIDYLYTLDPFAPAAFGVAWAGEDTSLNWFHIAREYTEKWHHQQQIRDAVGKPGIVTPELFRPCLATFMQALPHAYRNVSAPSDTVVRIVVATEAGGVWYLRKTANKWALHYNVTQDSGDASVIIPPDIAWRFFTKAMPATAALKASTIWGDVGLASQIFSTLAVMA